MKKTQLFVGLMTATTILCSSTQAAIIFSDDFNRAAATTLGASWDDTEGNQQFGIAGLNSFGDPNTATVTADNGNTLGVGRAIVNLGADVDASAGYTVSATIDVDGDRGVGDRRSGVIFSYEDADNYWVLLARGHGAALDYISFGNLIQVSGGVETTHLSWSDIDDTGAVNLVVNYDGTTLSATIDGAIGATPSETQTLNVALADGGVGLESRGADYLFFWDDFSVDGILVPEPASLGLIAFGLLAMCRRNRVGTAG